MTTKIYSLLVIVAVMLAAGRVKAQCGLRYVDSIFQYTITTVTYDDYDSLMDIYVPVGDTASKRPLIVMAHEGTFISGDKASDPTVVRICENYASRGFVTASINYRLLQSLLDFGDSTTVITEVIQALSDGKAAVRYFSKDAATANLYKVDTSKMFIGGNSAGAVMALHYGYITSLNILSPYLQTIVNNNGGLEGNSGNAGYTSRVAGVISCAGGLNNPAWVLAGDLPSFNAQGTADPIVPYDCGYPEGGAIMVKLCGMGALQPQYDSANIINSCLPFPGQGHVPWDANAAMFYSVDSALDVFLTTNFVMPDSACVSTASAINEVVPNVDINMFPNPAHSEINLHAPAVINNIDIYDATGRKVTALVNLNAYNYQLNTSAFAAGVYTMHITAGNNLLAPVVKRLVIE